MIDKMLEELDGNSWEELCQKCYKYRYNTENYREVPAKYLGDGGIEGFTSTGIVNQCYFPEGCYDDNKYYSCLREKITTDTNKMLEPRYKKILISLGVPPIKEWHFLIPKYRDKRILEHATKISQKIRDKVKNDLSLKEYIDENFQIIVQDAHNLSKEIYNLQRVNALSQKINFSLEDENIDWNNCASEKRIAITKKISATIKNEVQREKFISMYVTAYLKGIVLMNKISESHKELYADLQITINSYKKRAEHITGFNADISKNNEIFLDIVNGFRNELKESYTNIDDTTIDEICYDLIGTWLADCSLWFVME